MKKLLPDLIAILAFIILSFAYFFPADIEGRILFQHDSVAGVGAGQESKEYRDRTGERTRWTNAIFGGMPTYQMSPSYDSTKALNWVEKVGALKYIFSSSISKQDKQNYAFVFFIEYENLFRIFLEEYIYKNFTELGQNGCF